MRATVQPSMTKAVSDTLLGNDNLVAPISTFVSNYVKKKSNHDKKKEILVGSKNIYELPPSPLASNLSDDDGNPFKKKSTRTS